MTEMTADETKARAHCRAGLFWGLELLDQDTIQKMLAVEADTPFVDAESYIKAVMAGVQPIIDTFIAGQRSATDATRRQTDELEAQRNAWLKAIADFQVIENEDNTTH